ncbi:uncharacterized [Tachysurus ichikawai]
MRHHRPVPGTGSARSTDTTTSSTNATRSCDCSASQQPRGMERYSRETPESIRFTGRGCYFGLAPPVPVRLWI